MRINCRYICLLAGIVFITSCNNNPDKPGNNTQKDSTTGRPKDTIALRKPVYEDCYDLFFRRLPRFEDSNSAYLLLKNGKKVTMTQFFKDEYMSDVSHYGLKDLDADGTQELVIFNYTGGAHCCDEFYVFEQKNEKDFQYTAHLVGGSTCINPVNNIFSYSFNETLGYFFTCYACEYIDSSNTFQPIRTLQLKYSKGKFVIAVHDTATDKQIVTNLDLLRQHGFEKISGDFMDNGWRKEFAMNLAVWHYNNERNWPATKKLFEEYYRFADAANVWKEFNKTLTEAEKQNTF